MSTTTTSSAITTATGLPLATALKRILEMRADGWGDWTRIGRAVGLPWQTAHALADAADNHAMLVRDGYREVIL